MKSLTASHEIAWAAGSDAGNASMKSANRHVWSEADYNVAVQTYHLIMGGGSK